MGAPLLPTANDQEKDILFHQPFMNTLLPKTRYNAFSSIPTSGSYQYYFKPNNDPETGSNYLYTITDYILSN